MLMLKDLSTTLAMKADRKVKKQVNSFAPMVGYMFKRSMVTPEHVSLEKVR